MTNDTWRSEKREELIERRKSIPVDAQQTADDAIARRLDAQIGDVSGQTISLYWPFRGEPDLRAWAKRARQAGATLALPVVVAKATPLEFRIWTEDTKLERGVWNIPIPPDTAKVVLPDIVIAPVVGVDDAGFRLGYGGGFFDRTLAQVRSTKTAYAIGVGYEMQRLSTISPHEYDIAMDTVIVEKT